MRNLELPKTVIFSNLSQFCDSSTSELTDINLDTVAIFQYLMKERFERQRFILDTQNIQSVQKQVVSFLNRLTPRIVSIAKLIVDKFSGTSH